MNKFMLGSTALLAFAAVGSAGAADLPVKAPPMVPVASPVFDWNGFYVGGNLGGAWARGSVNDSLFGLSASSDRSGFIGGGQLGVNYHIWVQPDLR